MVFKTDCLANLLWIALYDYMKMYEWLLGVEYDDIIVWCVFSFTWIVRNYTKLLSGNNVVDVDYLHTC